MAHTVFETPNASYVLLLSSHFRKLEKSPAEFDALILETGYVEGKQREQLLNHRQFRSLVLHAAQGGKQIWFTDAFPLRGHPSKLGKLAGYGVTAEMFLAGAGVAGLIETAKEARKIPRRELLRGGLVSVGVMLPFAGTVAPLFATEHEGEIRHKKFWDAVTKVHEHTSYSQPALRNALTAEKAESLIAPALAKELGRKPVIAMAWGTAHYGVRDMLLHPEKRRKLLEESDLAKSLKGDYMKSTRLLIDREGRIVKAQEFETPVKGQAPRQKPVGQKQAFSRREFWRKVIRRA